MASSNPRMVQHNVYVDPDTYEKLRKLSAATRVSIGEYIRQGVQAVLDVAETQMDTVEKARDALREKNDNTKETST